MMILSLNSQDLGGRTKSLSLRALFSSLKPDIILLQETMCSDSLGAYKTWIKCLDLSDHFPIVFEWNTWKGSHDYHFKFNRSWLEDPDFIAWFMREWASSFNPDSIDDIEDLFLSLRKLKSATKRWTKEKFDSLVLESTNLELAIESILAGPTKGILSSEQIVSLSLLNAERHRILQHFLLTWQLKSRIK